MDTFDSSFYKNRKKDIFFNDKNDNSIVIPFELEANEKTHRIFLKIEFPKKYWTELSTNNINYNDVGTQTFVVQTEHLSSKSFEAHITLDTQSLCTYFV